jgi:hypothetical protein
MGQDLPVGVDHHLRDRVLLFGEDSRATLALERGPHIGDQLHQPGVGKVPGGPVQRARGQGQLVAHALPQPLHGLVVSPRLVPVAVQDARARIPAPEELGRWGGAG